MNVPAFFIIGSKRGGTTLLRLMLNRHSCIAVPPESHFIMPLVQRLTVTQPLNRQDLQEAAAIVTGHPRFVSWQLDAASVTALADTLPVPCSLADFIGAIFGLKLASTGKPTWGEKTPEYIDILPQLLQLFPGALFICMTRDGRDVSASLKAQGWEGWTVYQRAKYWQRCVMHMQQLQLHPGAKCMTIRYEDLVLRQQEVLTSITSQLGLPYEPGMLDFHVDFADNITASEHRHGVHRKLHRKPVAADVYRWRQDMPAGAVWKFEAVAGRQLGACSYDITRFRRNNLLHQVARALYLPWGALLAVVYSCYHGLFSTALKQHLRHNRAWTFLRTVVRRA